MVLNTTFGRQRVYWLEDSIFKAPHLTVDQSCRRGVKSLEQFISAISAQQLPERPAQLVRELLRIVIAILMVYATLIRSNR